MQGTKIQKTFHVPGTLSAGLAIVLTTPFPMTFEHMSAVASNNSDAIIKVGTTSDDEAYIEEAVIGDSDVPVEFGKAAMVDTEYPHIPKGTVVKVTLDHDGDAGTAAADVTLVLTFSEG